MNNHAGLLWRCRINAFVFLWLVMLPLPALGVDDAHHLARDDKGVISLVVDNDFFVSPDDRHYTNGFRLSYVSPEHIPDWLGKTSSWLPFYQQEGFRRVTYTLGQSLFTPQNTTTTVLVQDERPYAGWLYASAGIMSDNDDRVDHLDITLGMVGSAALGEDTQRQFHELIGSYDPKGWDNQLKNEPGLIVSYQRKWHREVAEDIGGLNLDITPYIGGMVGNIFTHAAVGAKMRIGKHMPYDYGPPTIQPMISSADFFIPEAPFGWYFYIGAEGRAVVRNIFLDGNTWRNSHSVDKKYGVLDLQQGIVFTFQDWRFGVSHVIRSPEYYEQGAWDRYGQITLSTRF